jgi:hypothetical protein
MSETARIYALAYCEGPNEREPEEHEDELSRCDVCNEMKPDVTEVVGYHTETWACEDCRNA